MGFEALKWIRCPVVGPADIAIVGHADQVVERVHGLFDAGATTFTAVPFGAGDEQAVTHHVLAPAERAG